MCGFFGCIGDNHKFNNNYDIDIISKSLAHRGPDSNGLFSNKNFVLGFRRLSILDLSTNSDQPISSSDGRYKLVFNGEIYNFRSLIKYIDKKKNISGNSDTEVLLYLLIQKKEEALNYLNGMFSFVFIDTLTNEFIIARDRLGIKPIFYSLYNGVLYFSSELPSLIKFNITKKLSLISLNRYIRFGHITSPDTIYENIYKLNPGHLIKGNSKNLTKINQTEWWKINCNENHSLNENIWLNKVDELLLDSTTLRLVSDVPTGIFLSGGIDSSLVAHYSSIQNKQKKPKAFTIKFNDKDYNEFLIAEMLAKAKNLELISMKVNSNSLESIERCYKNIGEPFSDSSLLNQYNLAELAKNHATVFLSGDGGDEAFAGYREYQFAHKNSHKLNSLSFIAQLTSFFNSSIFSIDNNFKQQLSKLNLGPNLLGSSLRINHQEPLLKALLRNDIILEEEEILNQIYTFWNSTKGLSLVKRMQLLDYKNYLEPDILVKVDRATMANSIESRSPFLDHRIVELAMQIPTNYNISNGQGKKILRKLAKKYLPNQISNLPKKGFGLPYRSWLTKNKKLKLLSLINDNNHNLWNLDIINLILKNADSKKYDYYSIFWRIWSFELWYKESGLK